ncbi:MAG: hypothetical protein LBV41_03815 [Cytophagaceae bacterium]|jgi:uncharacterized protein YndB with AHSA1/START domain|nr:hypothetical protein [Cytophagaceae bacterium]
MNEQKKMLELEYLLNTSPAILFNRLSTPSGLAEWFADNVTVRGKVFTFVWNKSEQQAEQVFRKENKLVRYQWIDDEEDNTWFEFQINVDELTGDVALIIIDHVDPDEENDSIDLWTRQIEFLKRGIGSL